jgi:Cu/Ag efflux pump CusA
VVVIGGQSLSLLLTLIVTPVAFSVVEQLRERARLSRSPAPAPEPA